MNGVEPILKRAIDVIFSAMVLLILLPVMAVVAVTIRLTMGRPVLFRQIRPGYRAKPFTLYKFRTMREAYNNDGTLKLDAERLTPLGRFLRKTSFDELPQLWNVLCGDLSLVGPVRCLWSTSTLHPRAGQTPRGKPGITGLAQVKGETQLAGSRNLSSIPGMWITGLWAGHQDLGDDLNQSPQHGGHFRQGRGDHGSRSTGTNKGEQCNRSGSSVQVVTPRS